MYQHNLASSSCDSFVLGMPHSLTSPMVVLTSPLSSVGHYMALPMCWGACPVPLLCAAQLSLHAVKSSYSLGPITLGGCTALDSVSQMHIYPEPQKVT